MTQVAWLVCAEGWAMFVRILPTFDVQRSLPIILQDRQGQLTECRTA
jgi:hypothetical protein